MPRHYRSPIAPVDKTHWLTISASLMPTQQHTHTHILSCIVQLVTKSWRHLPLWKPSASRQVISLRSSPSSQSISSSCSIAKQIKLCLRQNRESLDTVRLSLSLSLLLSLCQKCFMWPRVLLDTETHFKIATVLTHIDNCVHSFICVCVLWLDGLFQIQQPD